MSHGETLFVPPDLARVTQTSDLILGRDLAPALDRRNAILLVTHGIVTVGADVPSAVMTAILLDRACRTQLTAASGGGCAGVWPLDEEALAKREHCYPDPLLHDACGYLVRQLPAHGTPVS